eukprot:6758788-Alexandrium_andersonii.AAC.1
MLSRDGKGFGSNWSGSDPSPTGRLLTGIAPPAPSKLPSYRIAGHRRGTDASASCCLWLAPVLR